MNSLVVSIVKFIHITVNATDRIYLHRCVGVNKHFQNIMSCCAGFRFGYK